MIDRPTEDEALGDTPEETHTDPGEATPNGFGGVYRIDGPNGRYYLGRSRNLSEREIGHWDSLSLGKHHNPDMQEDYREHGREAFTFTILERLDYIDEQKTAEQALIDAHFDNPLCYNVSDDAGWMP